MFWGPNEAGRTLLFSIGSAPREVLLLGTPFQLYCHVLQCHHQAMAVFIVCFVPFCDGIFNPRLLLIRVMMIDIYDDTDNLGIRIGMVQTAVGAVAPERITQLRAVDDRPIRVKSCTLFPPGTTAMKCTWKSSGFGSIG